VSNIKITPPPMIGLLFVEDTLDEEGWTEVYWPNTSSYSGALSLMQGLRQLRAYMLTGENYVVGIRVSSTLLRGDTLVDSTQAQGQYPPTGFTTSRSLPSVNAWRLRQELGTAPGQNHSYRMMHGVPRNLVNSNFDTVFVPDSTFTAAFSNFTTVLQSNFVVPIKTPGSSPPAWTAKSILSAAIVGDIRSRRVGRPFGLLRGRRVIV
jgi:hypothetical protein